jgi:hypothetical protein
MPQIKFNHGNTYATSGYIYYLFRNTNYTTGLATTPLIGNTTTTYGTTGYNAGSNALYTN